MGWRPSRWRRFNVDRSGTPFMPELSLLGTGLFGGISIGLLGVLTNQLTRGSVNALALGVSAGIMAITAQERFQRFIGGGRLDNRPMLRAVLAFIQFAVVLDIAHVGFLLPLSNVVVASVHIRWSGARAWRGIAVAAVVVGVLNFLILLIGPGTSMVSLSAAAAILVAGQALSILGMANLGLVTARQERAADQLRRAETRFRALITNSSDVVTVVRPDGLLDYVSPACAQILGIQPDVLAGQALIGLINEDDIPVTEDHIARVRAQSPSEDELTPAGRAVRWEARMRPGWGPSGWLEFSAVDLTHDPFIGGLVVHIRDVTERREFRDQLAHSASHDALTGLINRNEFMVRAGDLIAGAAPGAAVGVLFCDLDRFKAVNDALGHAAGDEVLVVTAQRLRSRLRPHDLLGRMGGDEFTIALPALSDPRVAHRIAQKLRQSVEAPIRLADGQIADVGISIGVVVIDEPGLDADTILNDADHAMYEVKERQRAVQ